MQNRIYINYLLLMGALLGFFGLFVACGSQFYRISVGDDFEPVKSQTAQSGATASSSDGTTSGTVVLGIHAVDGWNSLPVPVKFSRDLSPEQRANQDAAMNTWEQAVGKKLFQVTGVDTKSGDDFPDLYSSLNDDVNGYYLDKNWAKTGKAEYVLATTIWNNGSSNDVMTKADIRFNGTAYIIGDSLKIKSTNTQEVVDMQSLALHELGHFLGLSHIDPSVDATSIMNPSLYIGEGLTSRFLSKGDLSRIQEIYGCSGSSCDIDTLYKNMQYNRGEIVTDPIEGAKFSDTIK